MIYAVVALLVLLLDRRACNMSVLALLAEKRVAKIRGKYNTTDSKAEA